MPTAVDVFAATGDLLGQVAFVLVDDRPGHPAFAAVLAAAGFGIEAFVLIPRCDLTLADRGRACLHFSVEMFLDAPRLEVYAESLDPDEEVGLLIYYDLSQPPAAATAGHLTACRDGASCQGGHCAGRG